VEGVKEQMGRRTRHACSPWIKCGWRLVLVTSQWGRCRGLSGRETRASPWMYASSRPPPTEATPTSNSPLPRKHGVQFPAPPQSGQHRGFPVTAVAWLSSGALATVWPRVRGWTESRTQQVWASGTPTNPPRCSSSSLIFWGNRAQTRVVFWLKH